MVCSMVCSPFVGQLVNHVGSSFREPVFVDAHSNAFVGLVITAFANHYPLELEPGHLWLLLLQGVAHHVEENNGLIL